MVCSGCQRQVQNDNEPMQVRICATCKTSGWYCAVCARTLGEGMRLMHPRCHNCRRGVSNLPPVPVVSPLAEPWPPEAKGCAGCVYELRTSSMAPLRIAKHTCDPEAAAVQEEFPLDDIADAEERVVHEQEVVEDPPVPDYDALPPLAAEPVPVPMWLLLDQVRDGNPRAYEELARDHIHELVEALLDAEDAAEDVREELGKVIEELQSKLAAVTQPGEKKT